MNLASKVAEIFTATGAAFNKLAELIIQFHPIADSSSGGKWSEEDIEMLHGVILRFYEDFNLISEHIKTKTISQIHGALKRKAFEDAGIPVPQIVTTQSQHGTFGSSSEVTLNMLNATAEVDVDVELNFGSEEGTS